MPRSRQTDASLRADLRRRVLTHAAVRDEIRRFASERSTTAAAAEREARSVYDRMAARPSRPARQIVRPLLQPLLARIFERIDVPGEHISSLRALGARGSLVLVPGHRSHLDYILISWIFFEHRLPMPHVVAGANLEIWPLSTLLRRMGAVFIPRSFDATVLWPCLFERYLHELVAEELPIEFFIEGGRTRTGRLRPPRFGVLSTLFDAAAALPPDRPVTLVPLSLTYDRVPEASALLDEVRGADKRRETLGRGLRALFHLWSLDLGTVYLRAGPPIAVGPLVRASERDHDLPWTERAESDRRSQVAATGHELVRRIGRETLVVRPSIVAWVLLASTDGPLDVRTIGRRVERWLHRLVALGVELSDRLPAMVESVPATLERLARRQMARDTGEGRWSVPAEQRLRLAFVRDTLLHHFTGWAFSSLAETAPVLPSAPEDYLRWLWAKELPMPEAAPCRHELAPREALELRESFAPLLETYALVLASSSAAATPGGLADAIFADGRRLAAAGRVRRPEAVCRASMGRAVEWGRDADLVQFDGEAWRLDPTARTHAAHLTAWLDPLDP